MRRAIGIVFGLCLGVSTIGCVKKTDFDRVSAELMRARGEASANAEKAHAMEEARDDALSAKRTAEDNVDAREKELTAAKVQASTLGAKVEQLTGENGELSARVELATKSVRMLADERQKLETALAEVESKTIGPKRNEEPVVTKEPVKEVVVAKEEATKPKEEIVVEAKPIENARASRGPHAKRKR